MKFRNSLGVLFLAAALTLVFSAPIAEAKLSVIFDIDGTLNNDEGPDAAWVTPYILQRTDGIQSMIQQTPDDPVFVDLYDPKQIAYYNERYGTAYPTDGSPVRVNLKLPFQITISFADFQANEIAWAPNEGDQGGLDPVLLNFDPLFPTRELLIIPGYYREFDDTYKYYRPGTGSRKKNYLVENLKQSIERAAVLGKPDSWKGEGWDLYEAMMSDPGTVANVSYSSMRGHRAKEIWQFEDQLVEAGQIKFSRARDGKRTQVFMHNDPKSRLWGRNGDEKKVQIPKRRLDALRSLTTEKHWERQSDGSFKKMHTLIVVENAADHLYNISKLFTRESGDLFAGRVKLVVVNAVNKTFTDRIRNALFPDPVTVIEPGRRVRPATAQEIWDWKHHKEVQAEGEAWFQRQLAGDCDTALTGGGAQ